MSERSVFMMGFEKKMGKIDNGAFFRKLGFSPLV